MPASDDFVALLTGSQRRLHAYIFSLVWNPADADDILQETNIVLLKKAAEYDTNRDFLPWALTIARFQALAGLKRWVSEHGVSGETLVAIDSGANVNFDRLRHISERAELGHAREALYAVAIPERPGSFRAFCEAIGHRAITEFNYRYADAARAHVFVGVELRQGASERKALSESLAQLGYDAIDLTDDEMAKLHIRHMVGGRSREVVDEVVYRFEFPERPGALVRFLARLSSGWNISMFHYRNHGAAYGRVLVGMQVPVSERQAWEQTLTDLGYTFVDETGNPAYRIFLG
jgi:threonine dehydratase